MASIAEDFGRGDHRLHDAPVLPDPLDHARRRSPRSSPAWTRVGLTTSGACGDITRNVVGCTVAGIAPRAGRRRPRDRRGDPRVLPRQQALLEPPAQVQDLGHGLPRGLRARPDQRRRAVGRDPRRRHARLQPARRRRPLERAALRALGRRLRRARGGARGRSPASPRSSATPTRTATERGKARLKFLVDRSGPRRCARSSSRRVGRDAARAASRRRPDLRGHDHIGVTPQADGAHSRGRLLSSRSGA